jgi:hypothetical protein
MMPVKKDGPKKATKFHNIISVGYDRQLYKLIYRDRWDPYTNEPIQEVGKLMYLLRKSVNSDRSRIDAFQKLILNHKKVIVFYNYTYERDIIESVCKDVGRTFKEWNGITHDPTPTGEQWCYAVQYAAGSEGWECITTNVIIFYSLSYSYKTMIQAAGRIDRLNTPFKELEYYRLQSKSPIDLAIQKALLNKKNFNESAFYSRKNHAPL